MWAANWDNIIIGSVIGLAIVYVAGQFLFAISAPRVFEAIRLRRREAVPALPLVRRRSRPVGRRPSLVRARYQRRGYPSRHLDPEQ